jgi:hypothetical protein
MSDETIERLILMPRWALRARASPLSAAAVPLLEVLHHLSGTDATYSTATGAQCRVIDSIRDHGPKLIEVRRGDPCAAIAEPDLN